MTTNLTTTNRLRLSLPLKFLLLLLLVIVPISVLVAAFNYITAGNLLKQQVQQQQRVWVEAKRNVLATALIQEGDRLRDFTASDAVQQGLRDTPMDDPMFASNARSWPQFGPNTGFRTSYSNRVISRNLDAYRSRFRNRLFTMLARPNGELVGVSTPYWPEFDQRRFNWWPATNAIPTLSYTGTLSIKDIDPDAIIAIAAVFDRLQQGKVIGVLIVGLSAEQIIEPNIGDLPAGESVWLVDSSGNALQRYDITANIGTAAPQITTYSTKPQLPVAWRGIIAAASASAASNSAELPTSEAFPDTVLAYAPLTASVSSYTQNDPQTLGALNALGWRIVRTTPRSLAYASLNNQLIALVAGTTLTFVAIVIAVLFTVGLLLLRPIRRMDRAMSNVAQGDFTARVSGNSNDELGRLGQSFNQMVGDLDALLQERERQQQAQREVSHHLQGSASELQTSVAQQNQFALQQATALAEISATFGQLSRSANRIAQYSQQVAEAADVLQDEQHEGNLALQQTRTILNLMRTDNESLSNIAVNLNRSSTTISDVISELNNLADETKLLALNAAIEASSAGLAGRRFAVVANEVQSLADQSATAAESAQQSLTEVQENIATAVTSIQRELSAISAGVQQSDRLESLMRIISDTITKLNQSAVVIQQDTKQQREGSALAAHTIDSLASASQQLAQRSAVITNEAEQLTSLARRLNIATGRTNTTPTDSPHP